MTKRTFPRASFRAALVIATMALLSGPARGQEASHVWPAGAERLLAADAVFYAPPDFKRQLAKNRELLMEGIVIARESDSGRRTPSERRTAAAKAARGIARMIREHRPFADVAREVGGLVHELAAATRDQPFPQKDALGAARTSRFLGYTASPFDDPDKLLARRLAAETPRAAYDAALTESTRLLAWIWKNAGGDAGIAKTFPEEKGPYAVRE
jgi:hypothetical protein